VRFDRKTVDDLKRGARREGRILSAYVRQLVERALADQQQAAAAPQ
jgi:hypothetical protein